MDWQQRTKTCWSAHPYRVWASAGIPLGLPWFQLYHLGEFLGRFDTLAAAKREAERHDARS